MAKACVADGLHDKRLASFIIRPSGATCVIRCRSLKPDLASLCSGGHCYRPRQTEAHAITGTAFLSWKAERGNERSHDGTWRWGHRDKPGGAHGASPAWLGHGGRVLQLVGGPGRRGRAFGRSASNGVEFSLGRGAALVEPGAFFWTQTYALRPKQLLLLETGSFANC